MMRQSQQQQQQQQPPQPPPHASSSSSSGGPTQGLVFSHLALILTRLTAYLPPHEAPLLREVSSAFSTLEAQHRALQDEVDRLRAAVAEQEADTHARSSSASASRQAAEDHHQQQQHAHAMTTVSTDDEVKRRIQAYRKAVHERNEKIAQLRREKEEALQLVQDAHKERLHESESRAQHLEARAERESAEIQQLTHLALSMQKTLEGLQGQVTALSTENIELKIRLEAAAKKTQEQAVKPAAPVQEKEKQQHKQNKQKDKKDAAATKSKNKAGNGGGGTTTISTLRLGNTTEDEEGEEEEFHLAINTHPKELLGGTEGVADYSSGEDERFFDYHDVTVLDEGEEEEDDDEDDGRNGHEGGIMEPPAAPKRRAPNGGRGGGGGGGGRKSAAASSASFFKLSSTTATAGLASKKNSKASYAQGGHRDRFYLSTLSASVPQPSPIQKQQQKKAAAARIARKEMEEEEENDEKDGGLLLPFQTARNRPSRSFAPSHDEGELLWARSKGSSTGSRLSLDELLASLGLREDRGEGEENAPRGGGDGGGAVKTTQKRRKK